MNSSQRTRKISFLRNRVIRDRGQIKILLRPIIAEQTRRRNKRLLKDKERNEIWKAQRMVEEKKYQERVEQLHLMRILNTQGGLKKMLTERISNFSPHQAIYYDNRDVKSLDEYKSVLAEMYGATVVEAAVIN